MSAMRAVRNCCLLPLIGALVSCSSAGRPEVLQERAVQALLQDVRLRQEAYHEEHGRYANHWRDLNGGQDTLPNGIRVLMGGATDSGWTALSSHPAVVGAACSTYHGELGARVKLVGLQGTFAPDQVLCINFAAWDKRKVIEPDLYTPTGMRLDYDSVRQASWPRQ